MIAKLLAITVQHALAIVGVCCLLYSELALCQDDSPTELINRHEALQQAVREQDATLRRHDPVMAENLISLADTAAALNLHGEASSALERAIQIRRLNQGLFTDEQIPLYFSMLDSLLHIGNWDSINTTLDHVNWLLTDKMVSNQGQLVEQLIRLSEFHLLGVAGDAQEQQARHYRRASESLYLALNISEFVWGRHDPRRIDLHYSLAKHFYLQSAAIERSDETAYALRAVVPGSTWVRPRKVVQERHYRAGLNLLEKMRELLLETDNTESEAVAMVDLYIADWHLLFNQKRAGESYQQAFNALLDAGREADELNRLFASPQILPIATFHDSVSMALSATTGLALNDTDSVRHTEFDTHLIFQEWFASMPEVSFPIIAPTVGKRIFVDHYDTWLRFRLNSLFEVSRWVNGTYESHIGVIDEFEIVGADADTAVDLDYLNDRLHAVHFRPRLKNGVVLSSEGVLRFRATRLIAN